LLDAGAGSAAQRVGLDFVLVAEADDDRALVLSRRRTVLQGAASNSERERRREGASLDERVTRSGERRGGADVDFEEGI